MENVCIVDDVKCSKPTAFHFRWDWGQEGICCDDHRGVLQTRSQQLGRGIVFSALARAYTPPQLTPLADDAIATKLRIAEDVAREAVAARKALETQIGKLETEREMNAALQREQELRIQDLLKRNAELAQAVELATNIEAPRHDDAGETTTVIEGASDDGAPPTPSTHGARGKRR